MGGVGFSGDDDDGDPTLSLPSQLKMRILGIVEVHSSLLLLLSSPEPDGN